MTGLFAVLRDKRHLFLFRYGDFSLPLMVQSGSGVHQVFYSVNIGALSEGVKEFGLDTVHKSLCSAEFDESFEL
jgi:hypothetical protein